MFLLLCPRLYAGEGEAVGFGFEVGVTKELPKNFDIGLFTELHTCQTFTTLEHKGPRIPLPKKRCGYYAPALKHLCTAE